MFALPAAVTEQDIDRVLGMVRRTLERLAQVTHGTAQHAD
jgi:hypothetical protein